MSKKLEKLREMNILINNVLCELETKIFIESDIINTKKTKKNQINLLRG